MILTKPNRVGIQAGPNARSAGGFTLIELILVMTLLVVVVSITGPALSSFFKGRILDSEARRFLALTRHAQSRAVSEGLPMVLWVDEKEHKYGIGIEDSAVERDEEDPLAKEFVMEDGLEIEVVRSALATGTASTADAAEALSRSTAGTQINIRFTPDAFLSDYVPEAVIFRDAKRNEAWLAPNRNRINYEIQTNTYQTAGR